jgi:unsaturated rhamnogalacturonyl hydrolase
VADKRSWLGHGAAGQALRLLLGAGWSKSGDFADGAAWETYVRNFAQKLKAPLKVSAR